MGGRVVERSKGRVCVCVYACVHVCVYVHMHASQHRTIVVRRPPPTCTAALKDLMTTSSGANTLSWKLSPCPRASIWKPTLAASWFLLFCWGRGLAGAWNRTCVATCSVLVSSLMQAYSAQFHEGLSNIGSTY